MSGTINGTDIHYTDDIGQDTNLWTSNQKVRKHIWAQTNNPMMYTKTNSCYRLSAGQLGKIECFSENSRYIGSWNEAIKQWKEYYAAESDKTTEIFFGYVYPKGNKILRKVTTPQPYTVGINLVDEFNIKEFLPVIQVYYMIQWDEANQKYFNNSSARQAQVADLKTYRNLMMSSGLAPEEFYKRYPIYNFMLIGYYGQAGERILLSSKMSTNTSIGFECQTSSKEGDSINACLQGFCGGLNASNVSAQDKCWTALYQGYIGSRKRASESYTASITGSDNITVYSEANSRTCKFGLDLTEFVIENNESLLDENGDPICKRFVGNTPSKIAVNCYGYTVSESEEGIRICPNFTVEQIMKYVALYGVYFTIDKTLVQEDISDWANIPQGIFLGHMDENGWTDGTYAEGSAIRMFDTANKEISTIDKTPYNPNSTPQNIETLESDVFGSSLQSAAFSRKYLATGVEMNRLWNEINSSVSFDVLDAGQYIVSLQRVPQVFAEPIIDDAQYSSDSAVRFGEWTSAHICHKVIQNKALVNIGSIDVPNRYDNFLDYSPYTRHKLYLPYIGIVDLPPDLAGKTLNIDYSWDIETGNCTAYVSVATETGQSVFAQYSGNVFGNMVISQNNNNANSIKNAIALIGGMASIAGSVASGNPGAIVSTTEGTLQSLFDINSKGNFTSKGSQGDFNNFVAPQTCKLIIQYPYVENLGGFGATIGFNCSIWGKLDKVHGLTVVKSADMGSSFLTEPEVQELNRLLETGVVLP